MHITKTLRASALAASLAVALGMAFTPTPAAADTATGNTAFKVILQPVTLLYYYSAVNLTIPSSALLTLAGGAPTALGAQGVNAAASNATTLSASLTTPSGTAPSVNNVALTLSNFWAVRSITTPSSGSTKVTVSFASGTATPTATLSGTANTSAKIALSNLATANGSFTGTGFGGTPQTGNVTMNMDLSNATAADTYAGATIYISATST